MSFNPPRFDEAVIYYRKAYQIDPHSSFAALRMENCWRAPATAASDALSQAGQRRQLRQSHIAAEATKALREMAAF